MKTWTLGTPVAALVVAAASPALHAGAEAPSLKEASLVTEVLAWGETVTGLRLEYSEEIICAELTARMPSQTSDSSLVKFHLFANRAITNVHVNNSGRKDDVAVYGRYAFIDLGIENMDPTTYRSQVTFNPVTKTRPRLPGYVVSQTSPIVTRSGNVIGPVTQKILSEYDVDATRIYAVSLAGGSVPMWSTILAHPGLFAAQISTAYDPYHAYKDLKAGQEAFARLLKALPGWFVGGLDDPTGAGVLGPSDTRFKGERLRDVAALMNGAGSNMDIAYGNEGELMWNGLVRGEKARKLADDQLARARAKKAAHLVTLYIPGTLLVNQHWCWDATYSNAGVRNWLFQHVNGAPYVPGR